MNRLWPALLTAALFTPLALAQTDAQIGPDGMGQDATVATAASGVWTGDLSSFIIFKERAFEVGGPIIVAGPHASEPSWSPTGKFLAFEKTTTDDNVLNIQDVVRSKKQPEAEGVLSIYSLAAGKSTDIMHFDPSQYHSETVNWIAGSDEALVQVITSNPHPAPGDRAVDEKLYMLDANTAELTDFSPWTSDGQLVNVEIFPSPTQSYAFIEGTFVKQSFNKDGKRVKGEPTTEIILVAANGKYAPVHTEGTQPTGIWSADGTKAFVLSRIVDNGKPRGDWRAVSLVDGSTTPATRQTDMYMGGEMTGLISVRSIQQSTTDGKTSQAINTLWLETLDPDSQNRLFLAGDATNGEVNKTLDCASYLSQGSLYIRPITEVPKERYTEAMVAWNHIQSIQQVRQAGLALIMFAADSDNIFPSSRDNLNNILEPYLRDPSLLNGFVYTFPGGPGDRIANPAGTQLGYIDSGDGRAIVYADGHSQWIPNPASN